jgi:hypothetical protein
MIERALALLVLTGCLDGGPSLDSVSPRIARSGDTVELRGSGLCGAVDDCNAATGSVTFDDSTAHLATISGVSATGLRVTVPFLTSGKKRIVAEVDGLSSNALDFEVLP